MSRQDGNTARRRTAQIFIGLITAITVAVGGWLAFGGGGASANFSSKTPVNVHADAGTLKLVADGSLDFTKLTPGHAQSQTVTFTNNGNVRADTLTMGMPITPTEFSVPAGQTPNWSQLHVTVTAGGNTLVDAPVTSVGSSVNLGTLNPGASKTVRFTLTLTSAGDTADNQWQGVSLGGSVTATARTS